MVSREDGCDSSKESQKARLHSEQAGKAGAEEKPSLIEDTLEPREMDATPAVTPPSPEAAFKTEEKANVAEYLAPTPAGYVTPTGLLSTTRSPTQPRTSPKRKQLSSQEGSEIAAGLMSAVKQHCQSMLESTPSSRLPGRMPYGPSSCADREEPEIVGGEENQTSMLKRDGDPGTPPMTPECTGHSPDLSQGEEPEDLLFVIPPKGDRASGMAKDELTKGEEDMKGNFSEQLDELVAPQSQLTPAEIPTGSKPPPPAGPDAPTEDTPPPVGDEGWPSSEPEPLAASTPPSSPMAEGWDDSAVPPFQWSQPLNLSEAPVGKILNLPMETSPDPINATWGRRI